MKNEAFASVVFFGARHQILKLEGEKTIQEKSMAKAKFPPPSANVLSNR
jgi:hypothetical protein